MPNAKKEQKYFSVIKQIIPFLIVNSKNMSLIRFHFQITSSILENLGRKNQAKTAKHDQSFAS